MIERSQHDGTTLLTLVHGRANALDLEFATELAKALEREQDESSTRALVITGAGNSFCAGVDLLRLLKADVDDTARFLDALDELFGRLLRFPRPTVAAINGHAIAGGCVLACACDQRIAATGSLKFGLPELQVGVPFPPLALEIVRRCLTPAAFQRVVLFGRYHSAEDALNIGLVDELVTPAELLERGLGIAAQLSAIPAESYARNKRAMLTPLLDSADRSEAAESQPMAAVWASEPARAAIRAYVEKTLRK